MADEPKEEAKTKQPTAQKRALQSEKKRLENKMFKSRVRTAFNALSESKSEEALSNMYSLMDKGVKLGVYAKNKAARTKSRLAHQFSKQV